MKTLDSYKIDLAIIGLGYVGLPLAVEFGKKYSTIGFDINSRRVQQLNDSIDITNEVDAIELKTAKNLTFTTDSSSLINRNVFIVTVPTPVDSYNNPDLEPICKATATIGKFLKKGSIVIFESTVYPGVTEDICVPILETTSGLKYNEDFFCGYSPERINPGDKKNRLTTIRKITSGSTPEIAILIDQLYGSIITGGTFMASSIKVAEAAKVIENAQRDINIAFMNEIAKIFNQLSIDTLEVLEAAGTKWNFLNFRPGLVGGHCIGVDPYYLAQKAQAVGYYPEIILAGRRVNDGMGEYIATEIVRLLIENSKPIKNSKLLILGITFKENCPDIRNTRVIDIQKSLLRFKINVEIADPYANPKEVKEEYGLELLEWDDVKFETFDCVILAVGHHKFHEINVAELKARGCVIYDVKSFYPKESISARL
jgi:UDP-N-acetyl-D-galactosamine dehydrogenase